MTAKLAGLTLALTLAATTALAAEPRITAKEFDAVIADKCVACHTRDRIDAAIKRGDKVEEILEKMLRFGVKLDERDRSVLGTFWGEPLK